MPLTDWVISPCSGRTSAPHPVFDSGHSSARRAARVRISARAPSTDTSPPSRPTIVRKCQLRSSSCAWLN